MGAILPLHARAEEAAELPEPLPLPPDIASIPFYTKTSLHAADRRGAINAEGQALDRDPERPAAGEADFQRIGIPSSAGTTLRDPAARIDQVRKWGGGS